MCFKNISLLSILFWVGGMVAFPEIKESAKKTLGATYRYAAYYPRVVSPSEKQDVELWKRVKGEYTVEPMLFGGTYFMLDVGAKKMGENDSVKQFTQNIPPLVGENVKFAFAAGTARTINTLVLDGKRGINSQGFQDFGKGLMFQVSGEVAKEYIIKPVVDGVLGDEESLAKDTLNVIGVLMMTGLIFSVKS